MTLERLIFNRVGKFFEADRVLGAGWVGRGVGEEAIARWRAGQRGRVSRQYLDGADDANGRGSWSSWRGDTAASAAKCPGQSMNENRPVPPSCQRLLPASRGVESRPTAIVWLRRLPARPSGGDA
jgi:hypothetical protein